MDRVGEFVSERKGRAASLDRNHSLIPPKIVNTVVGEHSYAVTLRLVPINT